MDYFGFIRECYLRSVPSVDITDDAVKSVNCGAHKLLMSEYDKILQEFNVSEDSSLLANCNILMLHKGPQLAYSV